MKWQVESHAVDRFVQRVAPYMSYAAAEKLLRNAFPEQAIPLAYKSIHGDQQWEMVGYPAILITKRERHKTVLVTVIEKKDTETDTIMNEEEAEEMLRVYYAVHPDEPSIEEVPDDEEVGTFSRTLQGRINQLQTELDQLRNHFQGMTPKAMYGRMRALETELENNRKSKQYLKTAQMLINRTQEVERYRYFLSICIRCLIKQGETEILDEIRAEAPHLLAKL